METIGKRSEQHAARWLRARGLRILARNFRARCGEIDIVAIHDDCLVFVEVRSRSNPRFAGAAASIDRAKQRRILRTAQLFLRANPGLAAMRCRFDVIAFEPPQSAAGPRPRWIRGAFTA